MPAGQGLLRPGPLQRPGGRNRRAGADSRAGGSVSGGKRLATGRQGMAAAGNSVGIRDWLCQAGGYTVHWTTITSEDIPGGRGEHQRYKFYRNPVHQNVVWMNDRFTGSSDPARPIHIGVLG